MTTGQIAARVGRRRLGYGRGARMAFEQDEVEILGGVRARPRRWGPGRRSGSATPSGRSGRTVMAADPVDPEVLAGLARNAPLTRPRPGHADLAGMQKYGLHRRPADPRAGQRAARPRPGSRSAWWRATCCGRRSASRSCRTWWNSVRWRAKAGLRTAAGRRRAHRRRPAALPRPGRLAADGRRGGRGARRTRDTLGGVVEVLAYGVPPGLGSARPVGPQARRAARRRAACDPGDQGRRDR